MRKSSDSLQQFTAARSGIEQERQELQQRLRAIDAALAGNGGAAIPLTRPSTTRRVAPSRPENKMNLREAITKVTARKPLNVREIVTAVKGAGYKFASSDPVNSLGAYLYGKQGRKSFKRVDGKFSAVK